MSNVAGYMTPRHSYGQHSKSEPICNKDPASSCCSSSEATASASSPAAIAASIPSEADISAAVELKLLATRLVCEPMGYFGQPCMEVRISGGDATAAQSAIAWTGSAGAQPALPARYKVRVGCSSRAQRRQDGGGTRDRQRRQGGGGCGSAGETAREGERRVWWADKVTVIRIGPGRLKMIYSRALIASLKVLVNPRIWGGRVCRYAFALASAEVDKY